MGNDRNARQLSNGHQRAAAGQRAVKRRRRSASPKEVRSKVVKIQLMMSFGFSQIVKR